MITEVDHALIVLMEECSEVIKACSKALRFGLAHYWDNEKMRNCNAIELEIRDVIFMVQRCQQLGIIGEIIPYDSITPEKTEKFFKTLKMSRRLGRVEPDLQPTTEKLFRVVEVGNMYTEYQCLLCHKKLVQDDDSLENVRKNHLCRGKTI